MQRSHIAGRGGRPISPLIVHDLCAQLIPLNRYGLPRLSAAAIDGVEALIRVTRTALRAAPRRDLRPTADYQ
jgi:hypothetical protein